MNHAKSVHVNAQLAAQLMAYKHIDSSQKPVPTITSPRIPALSSRIVTLHVVW